RRRSAQGRGADRSDCCLTRAPRCAVAAGGTAVARSARGMIRNNLSSRPFYNERAVNIWLLGLAVVVAAATIFNVTRARANSGTNTELASQASRDEARATELRRTAAQLRASLDRRQIDAVSDEARQAN